MEDQSPKSKPPNQHLTIHSPSPSTISYTISTRPTPQSKLLTVASHLLRILVSAYALAVFVLSVHTLHPEWLEGWLGDYVRQTLEWMSSTNFMGMKSVAADAGLGWLEMGIATAVLWWSCARRGYVEESLLVLQGLGIQTSTSSSYFLMSPTTTFIPTTQIQDVVIHEAFKGFEVKFYLAVIVEGKGEIVVVFPQLLPRRAMLEGIWRGARKCLYGGAK